ncbi:hypothetical protein AFK24_04535 [Pseudomonas syringae]|uniref:DUF4123 domain-containing protein n=1 Tax=Pseudomonas syringae TaxID=317 RepID=A0A1C7ZCH9_PSESX|nr:DUF4123 domain-containing protein [Pseudomonas syringae]OCR26258.1 hypothetical protein AFK24_04535 [Pseudomonas syringae]
MTELRSGPNDLPWSQDGYLLLNAVRTGNLLPRLYQWNPGIQCHPLFLGTRFKELLDVSPVLVVVEGHHDPVLQAFLHNAEHIWGLLLFSGTEAQCIVDHLRWLVTVDEPVGKPTLLNLSDPPVANALFELYPRQTDNALFGPVEHVYAVDPYVKAWRHHQRLGEPAITDHNTLYRLNAAQIDALNEVNFRNTVLKLDQHMARHFPDFQARLDARGRFTYFHAMASTAYGHGFHSESDILHYANVMEFLDGQATAAHPDITALLYTSSALTPSQRVQKANLLALERDKQSSGARP